MALSSQQEQQSSENTAVDSDRPSGDREAEKILCPHCRRTATNGIKCKGICVADNDY